MRVKAAGIAVAMAVGLAGCGVGGTESVADKDTLVVGVKAHEPGLGVQTSEGTFKGFDVDVARYLAGRLGADHVKFEPVTSADRESALSDDGPVDVDMVVASYSITPNRRAEVTFAGPYYVAHQDILVRANATGVKSVHDLAGRRLCQVKGSVSWKRITKGLGVAATLVPAGSYKECVNDLIGNRVDAVSTDNLILAGFAGRKDGAVRVVNAPFTDERYGVGVRKDDVDGCVALNKAITEMYQDGTAGTLLRKWFGDTSLNVTTGVPQFQGCY